MVRPALNESEIIRSISPGVSLNSKTSSALPVLGEEVESTCGQPIGIGGIVG